MTDTFELPSRLPEGPWFPVYEPVGDDTGIIGYEPSGKFVSGSPDSNSYISLTNENVAKAIASIPAMVEHIERLRNIVDNREGIYLAVLRNTLIALCDASEEFGEPTFEMVVEKINHLRAQNAELRKALKPFADWVASRDAKHESRYPDECDLAYSPDRPNVGAAKVGDLRKARAILTKTETSPSTE